MYRVGIGYDVHAIGGKKPLILGGIEVAADFGLIAHSDGDVVLHSLIDALLGALALGDIGEHFPDTDKKYKNISSLTLLNIAYQKVQKLGFFIENLDLVILLQEPKLANYKKKMQEKIAKSLNLDLMQVSIKATTTENLGFIGEKKGIATKSICLLKSINKVTT